ncbi:MAG TPA: GNAT family N-acetyltransferase [Candidatus Wallbacteria bacterium]|nr:GNAT family N-acetyltransferase [Candidatus Wallbacteria bacterium]
MKFIKLIADNKKDIWNKFPSFNNVFDEVGAPFSPVEHLQFIEKNEGEKIAAVSDDENTILGWIGIIPKNNSGYAELAGIEVHKEHRNKKIATELIKHAQIWLSLKGIFEFRFSTSPLFTSNTLLYMGNFNSSYTWNNTSSIPPDNILWPVVDCIMNWKKETQKDFSKSVPNLKELSILRWNGLKPSVNKSLLENKNKDKFIELPFLSLPIIFEQYRLKNYSITETPFQIFETLNNRGYQFKSFLKENGKYYYTLSD